MVILESENAARIWFVILSGMIPSPKPRPVVVELLSDLSVVLAALSTTADYWRPGVCFLTWYDDVSSGSPHMVTRLQHETPNHLPHVAKLHFTLFYTSGEREQNLSTDFYSIKCRSVKIYKKDRIGVLVYWYLVSVYWLKSYVQFEVSSFLR